MSSVKEVSSILTLDLSDIPTKEIKKAKTEVKNYLVNQILRHVGNGKSPVEGEKFTKLSKDYAKKEKGGSRLPNLELDGDMLFALKAKDVPEKKNKIWSGIEGAEAPKADGHNQLSGEAKAWAARTDRTKYKRRFIPSKDQKYNTKIMTGIDSILDGYRVSPEEQDKPKAQRARVVEASSVDSRVSNVAGSNIALSEFFSDDVIEELLLEELKKKKRAI